MLAETILVFAPAVARAREPAPHFRFRCAALTAVPAAGGWGPECQGFVPAAAVVAAFGAAAAAFPAAFAAESLRPADPVIGSLGSLVPLAAAAARRRRLVGRGYRPDSLRPHLRLLLRRPALPVAVVAACCRLASVVAAVAAFGR